jgi:gluconokinase
LAEQLGWPFIDADDYHPKSNIEKMRRGIPLNDDDRRPWLAELRHVIDEACEGGRDLVVACSALKHAYQEYLEHDARLCVRYVYLEGSEALIRHRLAGRKGHFMNPSLLHSQFETLEPPEHAVRVDVSASPEAIAGEIRKQLGV